MVSHSITNSSGATVLPQKRLAPGILFLHKQLREKIQWCRTGVPCGPFLLVPFSSLLPVLCSSSPPASSSDVSAGITRHACQWQVQAVHLENSFYFLYKPKPISEHRRYGLLKMRFCWLRLWHRFRLHCLPQALKGSQARVGTVHEVIENHPPQVSFPTRTLPTCHA